MIGTFVSLFLIFGIMTGSIFAVAVGKTLENQR